MSSDSNNHDGSFFPFADCQIAIDVDPDRSLIEKPKYNNNKTKRLNKKPRINNTTTKENNTNLHNAVSYIYFENSQKEDNMLTLIPYTGPSNTSHLGKSLYLSQLISKPATDSKVCLERFLQDYHQTIELLKPSMETMSLSVFLRFGISYILRVDSTCDQSIRLKDFTSLRNQGKKIKTAFYTCKGVTSPKRLLTAITKLDYHQISSNTYSYDIQLFGAQKQHSVIFHFEYDEQLRCRSVFIRPNYPTNFDFIRDKTSSIFRSIDHSYADMFDFRIQLTQIQHLSKTEPDVLNTLRGVSIDEVLFLDPSTHILHIAPKLQKFAKYLKCTRSSSFQNSNEQILISIGTYEEFQLNRTGQCESLMKASNTMTIELLDANHIPSGKKLFDIGLWFSTLCQTCVDAPTTALEKNVTNTCKWFSGTSLFKKNNNQTIKQMNVNQLTTYTRQNSNRTYTSEEVAFVKRILQEENLENIFLHANEGDSLEQIYDNLKKKLKAIAVPSANDALKKVERGYRLVCKKSV